MAEYMQIITLLPHWTFKCRSTRQPRTAYPRISYIRHDMSTQLICHMFNKSPPPYQNTDHDGQLFKWLVSLIHISSLRDIIVLHY